MVAILPHWKRCSYLVQMATFKKSPTVDPLSPLFFSVCETTVSHSLRDSHQSQLAISAWVLLDMEGWKERGWGATHSSAIYDWLSVRLHSVCLQGSRFNSFADLRWIQTNPNSSFVWWLFLLFSIQWKELCTHLRQLRFLKNLYLGNEKKRK